jgi:hypothetical protein
MKLTALIILAAMAALGTFCDIPLDKLSDAMQPTVSRHDEPTLVAQCGTMQYGYGAQDCSASAAAYGYSGECAANPSQFNYVPQYQSGYGFYGAPRYTYAPTYSTPAYGGYSYAPPTYYSYPAYRPAYSYPSYGFGFRIGW